MLPKIIDSPGFNAVVAGRYGFQVFNKNDRFVGRAVEKYGEFSEAECTLFRQLCRPGDLVVEVGSNIGTHTLALSQFVGPKGRVIAFEPQRIVFQTLCATLALNSVTNVEAHQMAVGEARGELPLPEFRYDLEGNFGGIAVDQFQEGKPVPVVTLDEFLPSLPRLRLLKIDVEGMEERVIRGARRIIETHRPFLYVENDRVEKSPELIDAIRSLGYRLFWHAPPLFNAGNFAGDAENLFEGIVSINMLGFHESADVVLNGLPEVGNRDQHPLNPQS
ncbi:MAG: FkbM family methyltransferase [Verrucomicrobiae bacterium]|nr:FkbM family methyltransferase [Verrucomicrobiae bacterium]